MDQYSPFMHYVNSAEVTFSNYDFIVKLGLQGPAFEEGRQIIGYVHMSPQHFKAFVIALSDNLSKYESVFGEINLRPDTETLERLQKESAPGSAASAE